MEEKITREQLLNVLRNQEALSRSDAEVAHGAADEALLDYIADDEIRAAFESIQKWYA